MYSYIMSNSEENKSSFFISQKGKYAVIVFSGEVIDIGRSVFDVVAEELKGVEADYYILCFDNVSFVGRNSIQKLINLQHSIRQDLGIVVVCGLTRKVKTQLEQQGAIRAKEIHRNLTEAFKAIIKKKREENI